MLNNACRDQPFVETQCFEEHSKYPEASPLATNGLLATSRFRPIQPWPTAMRFTIYSMVIVLLAIIFLPRSADASIFSRTWPQNANKIAQIRVCIIEGSSVEQRSTNYSGFFHDANPSFDAVIWQVREALSESWERLGSVNFVDWRSCGSLSSVEKAEAVGLFIHPEARNEAFLGINNKGHVTPNDRGVQFKPWGNSWNECISYNANTTRMEYRFECVRQYAIHEFGHVLGFDHEMGHSLRPNQCPLIEGPYTSPTYTVVNESIYDWASIMTYHDEGKCGFMGGVRFGGINLSSGDVEGLRRAYPPAAPYTTFISQQGTALGETDGSWIFLMASNDDVFAIKKWGTGSRSTEVHILSAASGYRAYSLHTGTPLHETGDTFEFLLAPNRDLIVISKNWTGSGKTEVHILSAASNYQNFSLNTATPLHQTGASTQFVIAQNRDIIAIIKNGTGSRSTELHVLSAASNYQSYSLQTGSALSETDDSFQFLLAPNRDLVAMRKNWTGSGRTEVHILSADSNYRSFSLHAATPLPFTGTNFQFVIAQNRDIIAIIKNGTGTRTTEFHRLRK